MSRPRKSHENAIVCRMIDSGRVLGGKMSTVKSVVLDIETSGLSPRSGHRIIEIGAVALEGRDIVGEFHSMVDPGCALDPRAVAVHGITTEMLSGNPGPDTVFPAFREFMGDAQLIAHNARFDIEFLRCECAQLSMQFTNGVICTLKLSRQRFPRLRNHRLKTVASHLLGGLPAETRLHRALDDARLTARVWLALEKR